MVTDEPSEHARALQALAAADWATVLVGIQLAETWLRKAPPGDPKANEIVAALVPLASHSKWEIRRSIASAASQVLHTAFEPALAKLITDDNSRVRQAAEHALLRRRDWQHASTLGRQHEDHINATLDDIQARFGARGRDAVKRAAEQVANTFARELYHEVIKLVSPLATSAERIEVLLSSQTSRSGLALEASRIGRRVARLRAVLDSMRAYTEQPRLRFAVEPLKDLLEEAASLVHDAQPHGTLPSIVVDVNPAIVVEVSRGRLVQAFTNLLTNAVESYASTEEREPIQVRAESVEGRVAITFQDFGCGMTDEDLADSRVLFATSKPNGTGFGLPLAIKIVESEHAGRLSLESEGGRGTTVRVLVPAYRQ